MENGKTYAATVELAQIVGVNPRDYSCTVSTPHSEKILEHVKFAVPVLHQNRGAGLNFMPEAGDMCYVFVPSDDTGPFVMGFVNVEDPDVNVVSSVDEDAGASFTGMRPSLEPGDIALTTPDENFVILRRGGVVQIGATSVAQTVYIPVENIIRHYCQKYSIFSPIGELVWDHAEVNNSVLGSLASASPLGSGTPAYVKFGCREVLQDGGLSVEVFVGRLDSKTLDGAIDANLIKTGDADNFSALSKRYKGKGDHVHTMATAQEFQGLGMREAPLDMLEPGLLSVVIKPDGKAEAVYTFQLDKLGNNFIRSEAHVHYECAKGFYVSAKEGIKLERKTSVTDTQVINLEIQDFIRATVQSALFEMLTNGDIKLKGKAITLEAVEKLVLKVGQSAVTISPAAIVVEAAQVAMGTAGASEIIPRNMATLAATFNNHTHAVVIPSVPSTVFSSTPGLSVPPSSLVLPPSKVKIS